MTSKEEQELLAQGVSDYVDACNAIEAFEELVQKKCRRVVDKNLKDYAKALGINLPKISDSYWWEEKNNELSVGLGATFVHERAYFWHALYYWKDEEHPELWTAVSMSVCSTRRGTERLSELLQRKAVAHETHGNELWIEERVTPENVGTIGTKLDALMPKWIDLWCKAGGIKALGGNLTEED